VTSRVSNARGNALAGTATLALQKNITVIADNVCNKFCGANSIRALRCRGTQAMTQWDNVRVRRAKQKTLGMSMRFHLGNDQLRARILRWRNADGN
jgi:hypothetical protein